MSERGRLPRRLIDDRRGYPEVRLVEPRGYPEVHVVGERRGYLVDERRGYPDTRLVDERRGYPGVRMVDDHRGYPAFRVDDRRAHPDIHEGPRMRGAPHPHPAVLEEELELQEVELRRLLADNRALVEERAELNREFQAEKDEVRNLNVIIADITAEKEAHISKLVDKRRKLEAELRANEHLRDEIVHLRGEIENLIAARKELSAEAASLMEELTREKSAKQQLPMLKAELDSLQQELIHVRTACELEQKGNFELVEQRRAMEKNMISMAQEIEQMRAELTDSEGRPWGTGGAYGMQMGSPKVTFANPYGDSYNIHVDVSQKGPLHPQESSSWSTYDKNRLQYR
ncbi:Protein FLX-like 3 [Dichanthelium oligosanthes]|uniref:Protein FLX-like 3 n=1 Tax=Dichanthelium oligosanthes TaxID=888268 RepID=A0A1E5ULT6_9POAL|nr:Protein FLX-like 3 [Dichanthelium oligosanthes]